MPGRDRRPCCRRRWGDPRAGAGAGFPDMVVLLWNERRGERGACRHTAPAKQGSDAGVWPAAAGRAEHYVEFGGRSSTCIRKVQAMAWVAEIALRAGRRQSCRRGCRRDRPAASRTVSQMGSRRPVAGAVGHREVAAGAAMSHISSTSLISRSKPISMRLAATELGELKQSSVCGVPRPAVGSGGRSRRSDRQGQRRRRVMAAAISTSRRGWCGDAMHRPAICARCRAG